MNTKAKGSRNERRSREILEAAGYRVIKAGGSLGEWDLVGLSATDVVLCQVKTRDWPGAVERQVLQAFPAPSNTRKLLHRWRDGVTTPDVQEL